MLASEIRAMSVAQREKRLGELRSELAALNMKRHAGRLEKSTELVQAKRDMARVLTVQRELGEAKETQG